MVFKLTPEMPWKSAIACCRAGDPSPLVELIRGSEEIPAFARTFISDIVRTRTTKPRSGRPTTKNQNVVQDLAIRELFRVRTEVDGEKSGKVKESLARKSNRGIKSIESVVYKKRPPK